MRCDLENVFLIDFDIYFGKGIVNFEYGLGYDVVIKLIRDLIGKYFRVFFDNYFISKIYW